MLFDAKSTLSDAFFGVFDSVRCYFFVLSDSPVLLDGGHHREVVRFVKMLRYPLVSCRYLCIFCKRMHLQYIEAFLVSTLGALPQTPASFGAPQGQAVKTQPPDPVAKCWVGSKASRVKCTASPPLTLSTSVRVAKRSEADGAGNLSRLAKQPLAAWPLQVGGDPTFQGKGAGGFPRTPATWRTRVWAAPTVLARPLGVAQ